MEGECERTSEERVVGGIDGKRVKAEGLKGVGVVVSEAEKKAEKNNGQKLSD